jgi:hypothetical protein
MAPQIHVGRVSPALLTLLERKRAFYEITIEPRRLISPLISRIRPAVLKFALKLATGSLILSTFHEKSLA